MSADRPSEPNRDTLDEDWIMETKMSVDRPSPQSIEPYRHTLDDYWMALYRKKWIILFVTICAAGLTWFLSSRIDPRYESMAAFYVPPDVAGGGQGPEQGKPRLPGGTQDNAKAYVTLLEAADAITEMSKRFPAKSYRDLNRDVDFVITRQGIIRVYVRDKDPQVAADVANGYITFFNEFHQNVIRTDLEQSLAIVEQKQAELEKQFIQDQDAIQAFKEKHQIASLSTAMVNLEEQRIRYQGNFELARIEQQVTADRLTALEQEIQEEALSYEQGTIILENGLINSLQSTLAQIEIELAGAMSDLRKDHPTVIALIKRYDKTKEKMEKEVQRIVNSESKLSGSMYAGLRGRLADAHIEQMASAARVKASQEVLIRLNAHLKKLPILATQLDRLNETAQRSRRFIGQMDASVDAYIARLLRLKEMVLVIQKATPPSKDSPVFPILILNTAVAGLGGLIVGVLYAFFLDHLDNRRRMLKLHRLQVCEWARELTQELKAPRGGDNPPEQSPESHTHG